MNLLELANSTSKNTVGTPVLKGDYLLYTPFSFDIENGEKNQFFSGIPIEDSAISSKISSPEISSNVTQKIGDARYLDYDNIRLNNLGPLASFNVFINNLVVAEKKQKKLKSLTLFVYYTN